MFSWSLNLNTNLKVLQEVSNQQQQPPQNKNPNLITSTPTPQLQRDVAFLGYSIFSTDEFRMYYYKIKQCPQPRSHDWTECPFAHLGEKAKRRDPRRIPYSAVSCPAHKMGKCQKGDSCEFSHGLFEYWLHPARYRTRPCNMGRFCYRKVCFFAHTQEELRSEMMYLNSPACNYKGIVGGNVGSTSSTGRLFSPVDGDSYFGGSITSSEGIFWVARPGGTENLEWSTSSSTGRFVSPVGVDGEISCLDGISKLLDSLKLNDEYGGSTSNSGNGRVITIDNLEVGRSRSNVVVDVELDASNLPDHEFDWVSDLLDK